MAGGLTGHPSPPGRMRPGRICASGLRLVVLAAFAVSAEPPAAHADGAFGHGDGITAFDGHAELVVSDAATIYLTDCASTNGTYRRENDEWVECRQDYVEADELVALGNYQTTARELLARVKVDAPDVGGAPGGGRGGPRSPKIEGPLRRDPNTGEVVRRQP